MRTRFVAIATVLMLAAVAAPAAVPALDGVAPAGGAAAEPCLYGPNPGCLIPSCAPGDLECPWRPPP